MPDPSFNQAIDPRTTRQLLKESQLNAYNQAVAAARNAGMQANDLLAQSQAAGNAGNSLAAMQYMQQAQNSQATRDALLQSANGIRSKLPLGTYVAADPCDASPAVPLLLLPVRLETRFFDGGKTLRIRIFPDTIHIDSLTRTLTADETAAGTRWVTETKADAPTAWQNLSNAVGDLRAAWVARVVSAPPSSVPAGDGLEGPVARLLPDRFVATVWQNGQASAPVVGHTIVTPPYLGQVTSDQAANKPLDSVNGAPLGDAAKWLMDYSAAETMGMAITVPLTSNATIDRLIVCGVHDATLATNAEQLDLLLESHRYTDGMDFIRTGTPTNNVDKKRTPWTDTPPPAPPASMALPPNSNAARLASALGISGTSFAGVAGANDSSDGAAAAVFGALWWPTWGFFLDILDVDNANNSFSLTDAEIEELRRLHRDHVRGRGPHPALRIGREPYGILPVGLLGDAGWAAAGVETKLRKMLLGQRALWDESVSNVPTITAPGSDPSATAQAIFGTSPVSFSLMARGAGDTNTLADLDGSGAIDAVPEIEKLLQALVIGQWLIAEGPVIITGTSVDANGFPIIHTNAGPQVVPPTPTLAPTALPVPLPFADATDAAALSKLASGGGLSQVNSVLQALVALAVEKSKKELARYPMTTLAGSIATANDVAFSKVTDASVQGAIAAGSKGLFAMADQARPAASAHSSLKQYQPDYTSYATGLRSYRDLASAARSSDAIAEFSGLAAHAVLLRSAIAAELQEALTRLSAKDLSVEDRSILVAEVLDVASHRLDAWFTALVQRRAERLRAQRSTGLEIGAYGVVENLRWNKAVDAGSGFIHAPSAAHAATAGILHSAYSAHKAAGDSGSGAVYAIDLTSARVRTALDLLASRRAGQTLSESLGYRIERSLHDAKLDYLIRSLRAYAPAHPGASDGGVADGQNTARVAGVSVVDGLALITQYRAGKFSDICKAMNAAPADNPYLTGPWPGLGNRSTDFESVLKNASDALDALGDLTMAEAVHQMALGNTARASAAMDFVTGDAAAFDPAVVASPMPVGVITHRVMLFAAAGGGWAGGSTKPRAMLAPELETWAAERLGPPEKIVAATVNGQQVTLAASGLAALDLLYEAGDRAGFGARLRRKLKLDPAQPLATTRENGWAAGMIGLGDALLAAEALRSVLASATPAAAEDLVAPQAKAVRSVAPATITAAVAKLNSAITLVANLAGLLKLVNLSAANVADSINALADQLAGFGIAAPPCPPADLRNMLMPMAQQRIAATKAALGALPDEAATAAAATALFGPGFHMPLPFAPAAADTWSAAALRPAIPGSRLRRWLADMGSVRPVLARQGDALLIAESLTGHSPQLSAITMGAVPGAILPDFAGDRAPQEAILSAVVELTSTAKIDQPAVALVIDHFSEPIPDMSPKPSALAFQAPSPGARPPQVCLLAISPDNTRWTTQRLLDTIVEALNLSRVRGVTLERGNLFPAVLPALYTQSTALQGELVLDWWNMDPLTFFSLPASFIKGA